MSRPKLMLVDGNSILNRAFYGMGGGRLLSTSEGLYTNAVYVFVNILLKYMDEEKPEYICVAFDLKAPTFRHMEFDGYKAKRKGMPDELAVQVPLVKEVLDAMNIKRLEYEGYEADDIIGSVSACAEERGFEVVIVTGDRDSLQLISHSTRVKLPVTRGGRTETEEYDYDRMVEKYGVTPTEFIDVKALMGDTSDNIPGVRGIGEKTAFELIKKYKSIDRLYEEIDSVEKESVRKKLEEGRESAFLSRKLATIERHVPGLCPVEEMAFRGFDREKLYDVFRKLEFFSLIERLGLEAPKSESRVLKSVKTAVVDNGRQIEEIRQKIRQAGVFAIYCLIDRPDQFTSVLAGIGISIDGDSAWYIAAGDPLSAASVLSSLRDVLEDENVKKIGHDLKNFILICRNNGVNIRGMAFDSMIAGYVLNPSRDSYTVRELAKEFLGIDIEDPADLAGSGKNHRHFYELPEEEISGPCAVHASVLIRLRPVMEKKIEENGQASLFSKIEMPLIEVLADMEYHGFRVNREELAQYSKELEERIEKLKTEIYALAGEEFNINSTKQLGYILFEKLGLPVIKKTKTGYSTDAEVLEQLAPEHDIIELLLEYRQLVKLKSTYAEGLLNVINPRDGRIHSSFNQAVTATGRISSTEPNLQNIPVKLEMGRKIRKVFIPEDGYILVDADYSQIELRVLAHITGDENMISAFREGQDIHAATAAKVFNVPREEVTPLMRSRAKAINFGIVYGIGDFSLSKDLGITRKQARMYIEDYLDKYPGVRKYMAEIVADGREKGFVTTLFNRRRYLPELKSKNFNIRSFGERVALNTPIQGSAADIIKIAMIKVYNRLREKGMKSRLILQVHDELIIEAHKSEKDEVVAIIRDCMENAVKLSVPLDVDIRCGDNWYETK